MVRWDQRRSPKKSKASRSFRQRECLFQGCLPSWILTPGRCFFGIGGQAVPQAEGGGLRQDRGVTHFCLPSQAPSREAGQQEPVRSR